MSIYAKLDKLESDMDRLNKLLASSTNKSEIVEIENALDKIYTEYNKLMDS